MPANQYAPYLKRGYDWSADSDDLALEQKLRKAPDMEVLQLLLLADPEVDRTVDGLLDGPEASHLVELLAKTGIRWEFQQLDRQLRRPESSLPALLVASSLPAELVEQLLWETEDIGHLQQIIRAVGLRGEPANYSLLERRLEETQQLQLEESLCAAMAISDFGQYQRAELAGDVDSSWMSNPLHLSDFLRSTYTSTWLSSLSLMEMAESPALSLGALVATCVSGPVAHEELVDVSTDTLQTYLLEHSRATADDTEDWEPDAVSAGLGWAIALGGEDPELSLFLTQALAHELLMARGEPSPGIPGMPISSNVESQWNIEGAERLVRDGVKQQESSAIERLICIRTLVDLADVWCQSKDGPALATDQLQPEDSDLVLALGYAEAARDSTEADGALLAAFIEESLGLEGLEQLDLPLTSLAAATDVFQRGTDAQKQKLGTFWSTAPVFWGPFLRDMIENDIANRE
jgi:hypothetical protein